MKEGIKEKSDENSKVKMVISEREKLKDAVNELQKIIDEDKVFAVRGKGFSIEETNKVHALVLDMPSHLANIAGFCDDWSKRKVDAANKLFAESFFEPIFLSELKTALPLIVAIQVDFNKRPFRVLKFDFKSLVRLEAKK